MERRAEKRQAELDRLLKSGKIAEEQAKRKRELEKLQARRLRRASARLAAWRRRKTGGWLRWKPQRRLKWQERKSCRLRLSRTGRSAWRPVMQPSPRLVC